MISRRCWSDSLHPGEHDFIYSAISVDEVVPKDSLLFEARSDQRSLRDFVVTVNQALYPGQSSISERP